MSSPNPFVFLLPLVLVWSGGLPAQSSPGTTVAAEPLRPQLHFSPRAGWMNDPNGMVYHEGEYHLFYQYYPDSTVWGPMHWGHAVSPDLLRWEELPIALYPDSLGYIFSGSVVVDHANSSGFGTEDDPPLVAIFTHHDAAAREAGSKTFESQSIAYSTDRGRSWTKYVDNPVLENFSNRPDFRDPKVIYDEDSGQWVMVLASGDRVQFYGSQDLKYWKQLSEFGRGVGAHGGVWECPDLFPMTVAETGEQRWVLLVSIGSGAPNGGSGTQYFVGDFDGKRFTLERDFKPAVRGGGGAWIDYGRDNYAGVTFSNLPQEYGRTVFLGWMSNWAYAQTVPTDHWRGAMTLPRALTLRRDGLGYVVTSSPVAELRSLEADSAPFAGGDTLLTPLMPAPASAPTPSLTGRIELKVAYRDGADFGVELYNERGESLLIGYSDAEKVYYIDRRGAGASDFSDNFAPARSEAPRSQDRKLVELTLLVDATSVELFADGGRVVMTETFFPAAPLTRARLFGMDDRTVLHLGRAGHLRSIFAEGKR